MTSAGLDVATSSTAEEGFYLLETAFEANLPFDGLLLDWVLPKMSGAQLMQKIMNDARYPYPSWCLPKSPTQRPTT